MSDRATWKSKTGFLLAALGSAIGLGNIWRFPYIAYRNGGGAFLIPYFVALFVVGVPLLMLEFGLGHYTRRALPGALSSIHPRFAWIGWWSVSFVMFGIVAYYAVVIAWCGNYLVFSVTQPWGEVTEVNRFFDEDFSGAVSNGEPFVFYDEQQGFRFGRINGAVVVSLAVVWLLNWIISRRHLQQGVELANRIFIPVLIGLTLLLVIWSWGFTGAADGRSLYLKPDWARAFKTETWIDAFSQIFFTLSVGFGIMVAYASYLPRDTDIPSSAFLAAFGNCLFSVVAGFAVFAAIGMLAHHQQVDLGSIRQVADEVQQLEAAAAADSATPQQQLRLQQLRSQHERNEAFQSQMSTFGLVFKTYPAIISQMGGAAGRVFGVLFFLSLVVAGLSSSISIMEAFMAALSDEFGWRRQWMAPLLCGIAFLLGLVFCTQAGVFWLDLVDHFITTYGLVLVAICESLIVGWLFPARRLRTHLNEYRDFRLGRTASLVMRLLITSVLVVTWLGLSRLESAPIGSAVGRFMLVASAVMLWIDEHWLDFDIRLVMPALLIFLLDQALVAEVRSTYEGYPWQAVVGIGVTWLLGTLVIGVTLGALRGQSAESSPAAHESEPPTAE